MNIIQDNVLLNGEVAMIRAPVIQGPVGSLWLFTIDCYVQSSPLKLQMGWYYCDLS